MISCEAILCSLVVVFEPACGAGDDGGAGVHAANDIFVGGFGACKFDGYIGFADIFDGIVLEVVDGYAQDDLVTSFEGYFLNCLTHFTIT